MVTRFDWETSFLSDATGMSTSLGRQMGYWEFPKVHHRLGAIARGLRLLWPSEARDQLHNYTTFTVVRHPFDRLVSAYYDRLGPHQTSGKFVGVRADVIQVLPRRGMGEGITVGCAIGLLFSFNRHGMAEYLIIHKGN